jgi:DNA invertase Pin-like site-specific DNA recombinase
MPALRAVAYYRMSTDKQEQSIPDQQRWAEGALTRQGAELVRAFKDEGVAGDEIAARRGLQDLLAFCQQRHKTGRPIDAVAVWDADRFSRANSFATAALLDRLMASGVRYMLTNAEGLIDFEDDGQRVFFNLRQDLGKRAYSKSVSAAVARTRAKRAAEGLWTGGPPPFAYVVGADGRLALGDPKHVEAVRWVFREYLARDVGAYRLAEEMNALGMPFPTYRGRKGWTDDLVYHVLTNPQYTGDLYYNRTTVGKYHRARPGGAVVANRPRRNAEGTAVAVANPPEEHIVAEGAHPAIIDRVTFEAAGRKLAARRDRRDPARAANGNYPFSGLVLCADCGACMYGVTVVKVHKGKRYTWRKYACSHYMQSGGRQCHYNTVKEDDLLDRVAEVLEEKFADPGAVADLRTELLAARRKGDRDAEKKARALRRRIKGLEANVAHGNRNLALARTPKDFERVSAAVAGWEAERDGLRRELEALEQAAHAEEQEEAELDDALALLQHAGAAIREAAPDRVRDVVKGLVEKVELRFRHERLASGRVRSFYTGGDVTLRGDLGCSPLPTDGSPTW